MPLYYIISTNNIILYYICEILFIRVYYTLYLLRALSNKLSFDILSSILFDKVLFDKALFDISSIILLYTITSPLF